MIKNLKHSEVVSLADHVAYQDGQIVSRTLAQNKGTSVTLFAFAEGEGLSSHTASGDALVYVLDGRASITIGKNEMTLETGQAVVMPAGIPHAVDAPQPFKMRLVVVKDA